jgi:hypothetical protein
MQLLGFGSAELVDIVTRPQAECMKNCGLIHSRGKMFFSSLQHAEWAWSVPILLFVGYWGALLPGIQRAGHGWETLFTLSELLLLGHQVD